MAVDGEHYFVIGDRQIGKYEKNSGRRVGGWEGAEDGPIQHLNSGVVVGERLFCANSNYPEIPMTSSVETWDTRTMEHVATHSFGVWGGSLTWVDWHRGYWWAGFAQYSGDRAEPGKDPSWTTVVQFDDGWRRLQAWVFPSSVVDRFRPMSNSGGSWGPDGLLYCTGHDNFEIYAMRLPWAGSGLELVRVVPVASFGQGIAWDRSPGRRRDLWGIIKSKRQVVVTHLGALEEE